MCSRRSGGSQRLGGHRSADASATPRWFGIDEEQTGVFLDDVIAGGRPCDSLLVDGSEQSYRRRESSEDLRERLGQLRVAGIRRGNESYRFFQWDGVRSFIPEPFHVSQSKAVRAVPSRPARCQYRSEPSPLWADQRASRADRAGTLRTATPCRRPLLRHSVLTECARQGGRIRGRRARRGGQAAPRPAKQDQGCRARLACPVDPWIRGCGAQHPRRRK